MDIKKSYIFYIIANPWDLSKNYFCFTFLSFCFPHLSPVNRKSFFILINPIVYTLTCENNIKQLIFEVFVKKKKKQNVVTFHKLCMMVYTFFMMFFSILPATFIAHNSYTNVIVCVYYLLIRSYISFFAAQIYVTNVESFCFQLSYKIYHFNIFLIHSFSLFTALAKNMFILKQLPYTIHGNSNTRKYNSPQAQKEY